MFGLKLFNIRSLGTALTFHDVELNALAFFQSAESITQDSGVMYEHVVATFNLDKTVTFFGVKPLYCSLHNIASYQVPSVLASIYLTKPTIALHLYKVN